MNNQPREQVANRTYMPPSCEVIPVEIEGNLYASSISANETVDEIDGEMDIIMKKRFMTHTIINGILWYRLQSNVDGYTGKWIFLPSIGIRHGFSYINLVLGCYWSSRLKDDLGTETACCIMDNKLVSGVRYLAMSIRPVTE